MPDCVDKCTWKMPRVCWGRRRDALGID